MSDSNNKGAASGGIGILGAVFIVFLVLKLAEIGPVAEWSWWWVTAPLWGLPALLLSAAVVLGVLYLVARAVEGLSNWRAGKARARELARRKAGGRR
jgi:hypothetical protein